jgi:homoserine/homoserine lactone efflux protein
MSLHTWLAFFGACWFISLSPGPGAVSCMAAGVRVGYRRALWNIFGLQLGVLVLVAVVAAGLGAVVVASERLFVVIKCLGVAYLVWLGIAQWRAPTHPIEVQAESGQERWSLLFRAFLINVSNPKAILFMLAVLPQFINPYAAQLPQYALCAANLLLTDMVVMSAYTLLASKLLRVLHEPQHIRWLNRGFGSLFVVAGGVLAGFRAA